MKKYFYIEDIYEDIKLIGGCAFVETYVSCTSENDGGSGVFDLLCTGTRSYDFDRLVERQGLSKEDLETIFKNVNVVHLSNVQIRIGGKRSWNNWINTDVDLWIKR